MTRPAPYRSRLSLSPLRLGLLLLLLVVARLWRDNRRLADALDAYVRAQGRMLDRWAEGDDAVKKSLWRGLHACEDAGRAALEAHRSWSRRVAQMTAAMPPAEANRSSRDRLHVRPDRETDYLPSTHPDMRWTGWEPASGASGPWEPSTGTWDPRLER